MKRAAILIGVDRTGTLPPLGDAAKGARRMEDWARSQKMDSVEAFTDEGGGVVDVGSIKRAVRTLVDSRTFDQLIIYFAGHGVNIRYGEYWLLSDAPRDSQAAINVRGSADLASFSGIPHVVLISDACRTAAPTIQAQNIGGSEIFPNDPPGGTELPVDRFFACTLGRPAYEVTDADLTAREFRALYTDTLLPALQGEEPDLLDRSGHPVVVRPRQLKEFLSASMQRRIQGLNLQTELIQVPDAHICSGTDAWIARLDAADLPITRGVATRSFQQFSRPTGAPTDDLVRSVLTSPSVLDLTVAPSSSPEAVSLAGSAAGLSKPFGPVAHESRCGVKIRGASIVKAWSKSAGIDILSGEDVRVWLNAVPHSTVILTLASGQVAVLPVIQDFMTALTVEAGELIDVAYEPSENSALWSDFAQRAQLIRALRATAAAMTRNGVFRLEGQNALDVARRMQYSKTVDPAMAVYAAYGYEGLQRSDRIREMSGYMRGQLGARLFDIALLARELQGKTLGPDATLLSFFPLLAQGWGLLSAHRVGLPAALAGLQQFLVPSLWTLFNDEGGRVIRAALERGDVL